MGAAQGSTAAEPLVRRGPSPEGRGNLSKDYTPQRAIGLHEVMLPLPDNVATSVLCPFSPPTLLLSHDPSLLRRLLLLLREAGSRQAYCECGVPGELRMKFLGGGVGNASMGGRSGYGYIGPPLRRRNPP